MKQKIKDFTDELTVLEYAMLTMGICLTIFALITWNIPNS